MLFEWIYNKNHMRLNLYVTIEKTPFFRYIVFGKYSAFCCALTKCNMHIPCCTAIINPLNGSNPQNFLISLLACLYDELC